MQNRVNQKDKLYLATFEFIGGECEQSFHRLLYAKNAKDMDKQIHKYWFIRKKVVKNLLRLLLIFNFKSLRALKLAKPHGLSILQRLTAQNSFKMDRYWAKKAAKPLLIRFCKSMLTISLIKQGNI